ncbi:unnamed protein product [Lathyrus sativus]|nr:unnamed protein product [Lathyrus sativus]
MATVSVDLRDLEPNIQEISLMIYPLQKVPRITLLRQIGNSLWKAKGERRDVNTIFLKLQIADSSGHIRNIHFPFDIGADTSVVVASEMVEELEFSDQDVSTIAMTIDSESSYNCKL